MGNVKFKENQKKFAVNLNRIQELFQNEKGLLIGTPKPEFGSTL